MVCWFYFFGYKVRYLGYEDIMQKRKLFILQWIGSIEIESGKVQGKMDIKDSFK